MRHLLVLAVLCCSCRGGVLNPPTGTRTPYPCGLQEHACSPGACCGNDEQCGGPNTGCPEGMCCYIGDESMMARPDAGPRNRPQHKPLDSSQ